jgi:hypothetical protein
VLSELEALRAVEGGVAHQYGVVRTPYQTGIVGVAFVNGRTAVGWDHMSTAPEVLAHELGHNFGRFHSPCGTSGIDANYPYVGGLIGSFGFDARTGTLRDPTTPDIMGYCLPRWISDYTFLGILHHRAQATGFAEWARSPGKARPGILVWGRITGGEPLLEPLYEVVAPPSLPSRPGRNRVELFGSAGEPVASYAFSGEIAIDGADRQTEHFAFVVPLDALGSTLPARARLSVGDRHIEQVARAGRAGVAGVSVTQAGPGIVRVSWPDRTVRGVLVRDARSGDILAFGRDGHALVATLEPDVDLTISDGVVSARRRMPVSGRGTPPQR